MATSTKVDAMMIRATLATMLTATTGQPDGADADHADDNGVFASGMKVLEGVRDVRAADARVARMVIFDTDRATPVRAKRRSNDSDMRARSPFGIVP
eukprot:1803676-Pyramimonas_sp.AAC.1